MDRCVRQGLRLCNQGVMFCSRAVGLSFASRKPLTYHLATAGDPIRVGLVPTLPRPRNPTISNTPARVAVPL